MQQRPFLSHSPEMLYIHWPFCAHKCHYCDFVAMEGHSAHMQLHHEALMREIQYFADCRPQTKAQPVKTIFFGGGTPSLYPLPLFQELCQLLRKTFDLSQVTEWSLEVNPGGQTPEHFAVWKAMGVTRLSVGIQVLDDAVLARMNRMQKNEEVYRFFSLVPTQDFALSADLIIGLPGVTEAVWEKTLHEVVAFPIQHVSLYILTVHEHTPLYHGIKRGAIKVPRDEQVVAQHKKSKQFLEQAGFLQYEISNFARPGFESRHNMGYWNRMTYQGFGLGAASFDGQFRYANVKKLGTYNTQQHAAEMQYSYFEELTDSQHQIEYIMLGLRQRTGVDLQSVVYLADRQKCGSFFSAYETLVSEGYLEDDAMVLRLTEKGQIFENEVVVRLCRALEACAAEAIK